MLVLALESATDLAGVALADESGVLAAATVGRGRRHGESMAPAVEFVCARAGVALGELDALAVDVGPGLFTGLRVGVATAKALGFALARPVVTATSLELLALGAARAGLVAQATVLVPVVDARRGQVFSARYRAVASSVDPSTGAASGEPVLAGVGEETLCTPEELAGALGELTRQPHAAQVLCVGDGALRHAAALSAVPGVQVGPAAYAHPDPAVLALAGVARHAAGDHMEAAAVVARYLREADVRINWEQRIVPRAAEA